MKNIFASPEGPFPSPLHFYFSAPWAGMEGMCALFSSFFYFFLRIIHINGGSIFLDIVWAHVCFFMCIILSLIYENVQALF